MTPTTEAGRALLGERSDYDDPTPMFIWEQAAAILAIEAEAAAAERARLAEAVREIPLRGDPLYRAAILALLEPEA